MNATSHRPLHRRGMGVAAAVAGMVGTLGLAGCGIQSTSMKVVGTAPTLQAANDVTGTGIPGSGNNEYQLYFFRAHRLTPVVRYSNQPVTQELILAALIKGPDSTDTADGYTSAIPGGLSIVSYTARDQQWNYQYSLPLDLAAKAEIVCSVQEDLNAPAVGSWSSSGDQFWNQCYDFTEDFGAPAYVNLGTASASPSGSADGSSGN
ncbi:hypothetical protein [Actinospica sp.]|uniref:hypothetical protein n=1 Tax=Actinospica sp. TaxID=1872142 RepID=UPI002CB5384D|nr:hypothetical protein [Actinospica sp.]HWG23874.1 hypothetical protein [Actinospica sp.]